MMGLFRSLRRAPARLLASIFAIALAVGAIGVFAVPDVAAGTLRDLASGDNIAHVAVDTTPFDESLTISLEGVDALETRTVGTVDTDEQGRLQLVGFDPDEQAINLVSATTGRLPEPGEALVSDGVADIGDTITVGSTELVVVGTGGTTWWSDTDSLFVGEADAETITGVSANRILLRHADPTDDNLDLAVAALRTQLAGQDAAFVAFPDIVPNGTHPIEEDLVQISTMIGLLGIVAGIVALTLLASTSSTLITERTREVAVMRALGSRRRPLRRRLRRLAVGAAGAGLIVGIPLGIVVANVIARMILERFVGVTPDIGVSLVVVAASAVFALGGAYVVAGRSARRVSKLPLAEALRDRSGDAWGRRPSDRLVSRLRLGGLFGRLAARNTLRKRARSISTVVQVAAGVGAVIVVASLATSVTAFNSAEIEPWEWETRATAADSGLPIAAAELPDGPVEGGIMVYGEVNDWDVDLMGLAPDTIMFDRSVEAGRWLDERPGVVVSEGFARHQGLDVGEVVTVDHAAGTVDYPIVGLHRSRARDIYVATDVLAADLGMPGRVNTLYSTTDAIPDLGVPVDVVTVADMSAEDAAARDAIVAIFMAIGAIVAGVTVLGVSSLMAVSLHERRHEMATLTAIGGRRRDVRLSLVLELLPLAAIGAGLGVVAGWAGAVGIIAGFEATSAVEIGTVFADAVVAPAVIGALLVITVIGVASARHATRTPAAVVLRGAA